jgi:hypothetical protein
MKSKIIFFTWFALLSVPLTFMMGSHSLSLNSSKNANIKDLVGESNKNLWSKLHFLGGDCGCSENIYKSLMKRSPSQEINEQVFIIGKNPRWSEDLAKKGYKVINGEMDEFVKKYSINAVPQLSILDDKKNILYSGGYTTKRGPASSVEDEIIYKEIKEKKSSKERPIFGCISGTINRNNTDLFKIKY